jgi:uroporphyrin-III C-methyltransferase/precorrin-2 dehydrogenase/sirohydrochlorin ferrochelatase
MRYFPMFLDLRGRSVLLAGGGEEIARKARLVARTEARLVVLAGRPEAELLALIASGRADHVARTWDAGAVAAADLIFAATGCTGIDALIATEAKARGAIVNVIDRPRLCTAITPALVLRDPLVIAIGTEGTAPALAREIRLRIEAMLEPDLGGLAALAGRLRAEVEDALPQAGRRAFWEGAFAGPVRTLWRAGRPEEAEAALRAALAAGAAPRTGSLARVALPDAPDLLTLRDLRALGEADLILHPPEGAAGVLDLARRDAGRGTVADDAAGEEDADRAVAQGLRVVLLLARPQAQLAGMT